MLISTPAFHHWHHTNDEQINKNYASMLPVMDLLFGTWYLPAKQWPSKYGIDGPMAPDLTGQLVQPFLPGDGSPMVSGESLIASGITPGDAES